MKLFLCESGGQRAIVAALNENSAQRICALAEIKLLGLEVDENVEEFIHGWSARELITPIDEGLQLAWWH